ncbi:MAG: chemotaxis protein CheW [Bacillota bacterium]|nr:chemotaxis protein CheW [Bacillota bacterium]
MEKRKYFTFEVNKEHYALPIDTVNQIIGLQDITLIPNQPKYLKGVINLRGQIIPIVDFRLRLGMEPLDYTDKTSIVVTENKDVFIGFIVDEVSEVLEIEDKDISKQSDKKIKKENAIIDGFYKTEEFIIKILNYNQVSEH